jgi:hypothetical protein
MRVVPLHAGGTSGARGGRTLRLLLLGETGHGKSTLANCLANVFLGVAFEDETRYRLVEPAHARPASASGAGAGASPRQSSSQTTEVITYTFRVSDRLVASETWLEIIDTPGFCDTRGLAQDAANTALVENVVLQKDTIHAVCFVVNASTVRLSAPQRYLVGKVREMFERAVLPRVGCVVATFADGNRAPLVRDALVTTQSAWEQEVSSHSDPKVRREYLPYRQLLEFNNGALFDGADAGPLSRLCWDMCAKSAAALLRLLASSEAGVPLGPTHGLIAARRALDEGVRARAACWACVCARTCVSHTCVCHSYIRRQSHTCARAHWRRAADVSVPVT